MNHTFRSPLQTWNPAVPYKALNNIVSSDYTRTRVFIPSYEKELRPCIGRLLSNDYQRTWWQEKQNWEKRFSKEISTRKILPHMIIKRKVPVCKTIKFPSKSERLRGKKKKQIKQDSNEKSQDKETKQSDKVRLNECEDDITKTEELKEDKETKSEECPEIKLREENKSEVHEPTKLEECEDIKLENCAEEKLNKNEETGLEKCEETELEKRKEEN